MADKEKKNYTNLIQAMVFSRVKPFADFEFDSYCQSTQAKFAEKCFIKCKCSFASFKQTFAKQAVEETTNNVKHNIYSHIIIYIINICIIYYDIYNIYSYL